MTAAGGPIRRRRAARLAWTAGLALVALVPSRPFSAAPQEEAGGKLPVYLEDRGRGVATSLFGIYVRKGEWVVYPFYEFTKNDEEEYKPSELGFVGGRDFLGKRRDHEALVFAAYGLTDRVIVEVESALYTRATLHKSPQDTSGVPARLEESGLGDTQAEVRWRWAEETQRRPELFSFLEIGFPLQRSKVLIGTHAWEYNLGLGVIKGHSWGTLTGRATIAYDGEDQQIEFGEYAVEYLKRISQRWRIVGALEGESDELQAIFEGQARLGEHVLLKLNSGFGLTSKAPDFAPEVGVLFSF